MKLLVRILIAIVVTSIVLVLLAHATCANDGSVTACIQAYLIKALVPPR